MKKEKTNSKILTQIYKMRSHRMDYRNMLKLKLENKNGVIIKRQMHLYLNLCGKKRKMYNSYEQSESRVYISLIFSTIRNNNS